MSLQQPTPAVQYCTCPHLSQQLALQATHVLAAAPGPRPGPAVMGVESSGGGPGGMEQARPKKKKKLSEAEVEAEVLRSHSSSSKWVYACVHCSYSGHKDDEHFRDHFSADNGGSGCGSGCGGGHSVVVDVVNRELYCMQCQDYQYHDVFDRLVNHCRPGKDFMHQRRKIPLGIVNMGSTCFMSSVLQLLLSSPALVRFFEISECFVVKCKINEVENSTGKNMLCIFCELQKVFLSTNSPMCPR
jgi:ubiquitin carboxyl-terminal hydrolase 22/27/51